MNDERCESSSCPTCGASLSTDGSVATCLGCMLQLGMSGAGEEGAKDGARPGLSDLSTDLRLSPVTGSTDEASEAVPPGKFTGPRQLAGYRILHELGAGGMGTVFEALDTRMNRHVALKVLATGPGATAHAAVRFEQEAWIAGRLSHPNLVRVFERGEAGDCLFYAMELVKGGSIADLISNLRRWGRDDRLQLRYGSREYVDWTISRMVIAARALHYAHEQGVVHRDIKPANLLIDARQDTVKIVDFGLALDTTLSARLSRSGAVMGTLSYMPPEQLLGKKDAIDARSDVYSLGITLFEMLTLALPFLGDTREEYMQSALNSQPRRARKLNQSVGRDLEVVLNKAFERSPADRYADAAAFADDLERVLRLQPIVARPPSTAGRLARWARRKPVHAALAATLILGVPTTGVLVQRAVQHQRLVHQQKVDALHDQMRLFSYDGDYRKLFDAASLALALEPDDTRALRKRAVAAMKLAVGDGAGGAQDQDWRTHALRNIERFAELQPDSASAARIETFVKARLSGKSLAEASNALADLDLRDLSDDDLELEMIGAKDRGNVERTLEAATLLEQRDPSRLNAKRVRAWALQEKGQFRDSLAEYRLIAVIDPDDWNTRFAQGELNLELEELDVARAAYEQAAELEPEMPLLHERIAFAATSQAELAHANGDDDRSLAYLRDAQTAARRSIGLDKDSAEAAMILGQSLLEQQKLTPDDATLEEALLWTRKAASLFLAEGAGSHGGYLDALNNICDLQIQSGGFESARKACEEYVKRVPDDPYAHYNLAAAYVLGGRLDEAFAHLRRDVELGDDDHLYLSRDPWFASVRDDDRFNTLIEDMKRLEAQRIELERKTVP